MPKTIKDRKPNGYWTKERILEEIKGLHFQGQDISARHSLLNHTKLFKGALKEFASWENAIKNAGINYSQILKQKQWKDKEILENIKEYDSRGVNLSCKNIRKINPPLVYSTERHFGSWAKAITTAGLDYYNKIAINKNKYWTCEKIIQKIKELHSNNISLNSQSMQKGKNRDLFDAAKNKFGSWENAIKNAGLDYQEISKLKSQTKEYKRNLKERLSDEKLKDLVLNEKMTQLEIADNYKTTPNIIAKKMKKLGLPTLNKKFGCHQKAIAKDGHKVDSRYEKIVDDWLTENNLPHKLQPKLVNNRNFRADFLVLNRFYIEVLGLWGIKDYEQKFYKKEMLFLMQEGVGFIILDDSDDIEKHKEHINEKKKVLILLKPNKNHQITKKYLDNRIGFLKEDK